MFGSRKKVVRGATRASWLVNVVVPAALFGATSGCGDDESGSGTVPGETDPPALTPYDVRGPYPVGFATLDVPADGVGPALTVKAWYPASSGAGEADEIEYDVRLKQTDWQDVSPAVVRGHARRDAAADVDGGRRPIVVFSHGYSLNPEWYAELVEHYASKGFVVLAPEHHETNWMEAAVAAFERPADIRRTIDRAERLAAEEAGLGGILDPGRIAVVGHSFGGYTALAAAGARFDLAPFEEQCAALDPEDPKTFLCAPFLGRVEEMAALAGLEAPPEGLWPAQGDARVDAIVPMAGDAFLFNPAGLASITVPTMAIGGTMDFVTPWDWGAQLAYDHVASPRKSLVAFEGGGHMIPTDSCENMPFTASFPDLHREVICSDPAWDKAAARQWIRHHSTAFLLEVLAADEAAKSALGPGAEVPPGIVHSARFP